MTEAQSKRFYFPAWNRCAATNGWVSVRSIRDNREANAARSEWHGRVWKAAEELAERGRCTVDARVLRLACHVVALGSPVSSKKLTTTALNRAVALFRLLTDPECLAYIIEFQDPCITRSRVLIKKIQAQCPEAYVRHVSQDLFGRPDWQGLKADQLLGLARKLAARTDRYHAVIGK